MSHALPPACCRPCNRHLSQIPQRQTCVEAEPHIWWLLSVPHTAAPPSRVHARALEALVRRAAALYRVAHGRVQVLADAADAGGGVAAFVPLQAFVRAYVAVLCRRRCAALGAAVHPLSAAGSGLASPAPLDHAASLLAASLLGCLESLCGDAAVARGALLFGGRVLAASVDATDLAPIVELLRNAGVSEAEDGNPSRSGFFFSEGGASNDADAATVPHSLSSAPWRVGRDGAVRAYVGAARAPAPPAVWLEDGVRRSEMLALRCEGVLIVLLLREGVRAEPLYATVLEAVGPRCGALARAAASAIVATNGGHLPGYRFACMDADAMEAAGTPTSKLRTLAPESVAAAAVLRSAAEDAAARGDCDRRQLPFEVWGSSSLDVCALSRVAAGGKQTLHCVVEGAPPDLGKLPSQMGAFCVGSLLRSDA